MKLAEHNHFGAGLAPAILLFFVLVAVFWAIPAGKITAQSAEDISVALSPETPGANQTVTANVSSYAVDLDRMTVGFSVDGKIISTGVGKKSASFKVGAVGEATRLVISIQGQGNNIVKTVVIIPGEVDLLWQAVNSYTPPFYRGKALLPPQGSVRVVAIPSLKSGGVTIKPGTLVYNWKKNGSLVQSASGYGKNIFSFVNNYLDPAENVSLDVSSVSGSARASAQISIPFTDPFLLFYENSPLGGVLYNRALVGSYQMPNNESRLSSEPYFFSYGATASKNDFSYSWQLNGGVAAGAPDDVSSLVLRNESGSGTAQISLSVAQPQKLLQKAQGSLLVNFGNR